MSTSRKPPQPDDFSSEWRRQKIKADGMPEATAGDPVCTSGPTLRAMGSRLGHHRTIPWQPSVTRTLVALAFSLCGVAPCKNDAA
jgi:hypothetical protein